ncbi:MAG TPA: N-acetylmuramoyl-L-alanine amidase [Lamprocystis sp. (in: g-proteobacteria)]|nr:N-acetylmuramoyl-L-alanine amidase [Lamprocystis sp. (in: g-proteobacteria)]
MKRFLVMLLSVLLALLPFSAPAGPVSVTGVRIISGADKTRLVLDLSGPGTHQIFPLEAPDRVVIDITDAVFEGKLPPADAADPSLTGLRSGVRETDDLRIVLDLKQPVRVKSFPMTPDADHGHRLVVDLIPKGTAKAGPGTARAGVRPVVSNRASPARDLVVAIDAGHGGEDPGAIGAHGTHEKNVTLSIARRLAALVEKEPGMRPVMIRDRDLFVPLRQRIQKARKAEADIFISIHADAFTDPKVRGSSVFTLSRGGASSEAAKWLADRENSADRIGGVDLGASDEVLAGVLLDMVQNATLEHSTEAARAVLGNLSRLGVTHRGEVQKAGFMVLKAPDIPALLVETAFISNPDEEARLLNGANQQRLAEAILAGVKQYFRKYRPQSGARAPDPKVADTGAAPPAATDDGARRHAVTTGDTLAEIAKRYRVSRAALRTANNLAGDTIRTGQVLTIPGAHPEGG